MTRASLSNLSLVSHKSHSPVPIPPPGTIAHDGGMVHTLSHTNCVQGPEDQSRIVATIYYNSAATRHPHLHPDQSPAAQTTGSLPIPEIIQGSAPTTKIAEYPLEPPAPEPEPLDHLYGPYISQLCLTHFLSTLDSLLIHNAPAHRRLTSSHRCLAPDSDKPRVMEVTFSPAPNPEYLPYQLISKHESIYRFEREWNCEVILQPASVFRRHKRLCVFDMDSTLIQHEVIDEVAAFVGVKAEVAKITERAMNGELDFATSLKARVALLKGVPSDVFEQLKPTIKITPGARELCRCLKKLGFSPGSAQRRFPAARRLAGRRAGHRPCIRQPSRLGSCHEDIHRRARPEPPDRGWAAQEEPVAISGLGQEHPHGTDDGRG